MSHSVTLVTPSYAKDLERFTLQRESIERCGIDLPHCVLVNHEDLALFEKIPFRRNLRILSTRELLPPRFEARRLGWGKPRRSLAHWKGRPGIHGWYIQQLLKLAAPQVVETEGIVCLDSDTLFVDRLTADDFFAPDGRMHLFETEDTDCEMGEWYIRSLKFLGESLRNRPVLRTTHSPVPMHRQVMLDMQTHIEKQHGVFWMEAMARTEMIMEYSTYGAFARYVDKLRHVVPARPQPLSLYFWWSEDMDHLLTDLVERVQATRPKTVLINSSHGRPVSAYRALIEQAWAIQGH
jgi:hypothetical protein